MAGQRLAALGRRGLRTSPPSPSEAVGVTLLAVALGLAVAGGHLGNGGFYWDDWQWAADYVYPPGEAPLANAPPDVYEFRPLSALWVGLAFKVFGLHTVHHLAFAASLGALTAACVYLAARTLGLEPLHAGVIGLLTLLFPWADSTHLYTTNALNNVAVILYLIGLVVSLRGLDRAGRNAVALALTGTALYVVSVLMYEVTVGVALLSIVFYLLRAPARRALLRWSLDLVVVGAAAVYVASRSPRPTQSLRGTLGHVRIIVTDALELLASATVSWDVPRAAGAAILLAVGVVAVAAWRRLGAGSPTRAQLGRWLAVAAVATFVIAAGYLPFAAAEVKYRPSAAGIGDRVNIVAAPGYAALIYAAAMLAGTLLCSRRRSLLRLAPAVAVGLSAIVAVGYLHRVNTDKGHWDRSRALQDEIVEVVRRTVPDPPDGATVYTFGAKTYAGPGIAVFAHRFDLRGALRVRLREPTLRAFPIRRRTRRWDCGREFTRPAGGRRQRGRYGRVYFVDVPHRRSAAIRSQAECRRLVAGFLDAARR